MGTEVSVTPPARLSWGNLAGQDEHAGRKEGKAAEVTPLAVQGAVTGPPSQRDVGHVGLSGFVR